MNRRDFMKVSAGSAAFLALARNARAWNISPALRKFPAGHYLPGLAQLGLAQPDNGGVSMPFSSAYGSWSVKHYSMDIGEFSQRLHPDLGGKTKIWGYGQNGMYAHVGPLILANRNEPIQITFTNKLPNSHPLPVDITVPGAEVGENVNRTAVHLHGGYVPWISDGGPYDWWTPDGQHGDSFLNNEVLNPANGPDQAEYYYPNLESARLMWYHDHARGITRLNAQAGLASGYILREQALEVTAGLPVAELGGREVPLVFQDKIFNTDGSQWYPDMYDTAIWPLAKGFAMPAVPSAVAEFFGDTTLVNGVAYPTLQVETNRRYRFRILNACNTRFVNLQLFVRDNSTDGITLDKKGAVLNAAGPAFVQIGCEGGFLPAPVVLNNPPLPVNPVTFTGNLLLAPAERADILIDFAGMPVGTKLIFYSDAPVPFPAGDPRFDFYPGNKANAVPTQPGYGPDTRQLLQLEVVAATGSADPPLNLAILPSTIDPLFVTFPVKGQLKQVPVRDLTLNEGIDLYGRLKPSIGTNMPNAAGGFGIDYTDAPTEIVTANSLEIWRIFNLTGDTHPIHFHLGNIQMMERQAFSVANYNGTPKFMGNPIPPEPNEKGWKETFRSNPGECTKLVVKFTIPPGLPFTIPESPRLRDSFGITGAAEYVYHCHILEHEDHDMMRPLVVK
jgi:spore coat protein A